MGKKITQLTAVTTPNDADLLLTTTNVSTTPISKKVTWTVVKAFLKTYFDTLYNDVAGVIHSATTKTTPVDGDEFGIVDSASSNTLKRLSWANLKATLKTYFDLVYAPPQGTGQNYRISVTVSSNNLTVALKGMDGNNPSSTNPVSVRIGNTIRTVTSALSVTANASTNWFNAGSTVLAGNEVDYFVYLGYNSTDGVQIGFSRIPYANQYGDFSPTASQDKYCKISTITNATSTDYYEVIGRFAATLSGGYAWSVPAFNAINLINRPIYETRSLTFTQSVTYTGGTTDPTSLVVQQIAYRIQGKSFWCHIQSLLTRGSGNRAAVTFSIPWGIFSVYASPANGMNTVTAAGLKTCLAYISGPTIVFSETMANDGTYYITAVHTMA